MAASDKPYRNQNSLDIVFAISNILMLASVVWMFTEDHYREFKPEQRGFRDVESAMAQRIALEMIPSPQEFAKTEAEVQKARDRRDPAKVAKELEQHNKDLLEAKEKIAKLVGEAKALKTKDAKDDKVKAAISENLKDLSEEETKKANLDREIAFLTEWQPLLPEIPQARENIKVYLPKKERSEVDFQTVKADVESLTSFYNIEVDRHGRDSELAQMYFKKISELEANLNEVQATRDGYIAELQKNQQLLARYEAPLTKALGNLKKVNDKFDTQIKLAMKKEWGWGDWFRALPVIDGFASPIKIHQFTINDIPIDYNFKYVTRYDRCMSCHLGIDRPAYTKENLRNLTKVTDDQAKKLYEARLALQKRQKAVAGLEDVGNLPTKNDMTLNTVSPSFLTESRVNEFCAHPRLEVFVGSNSKHPAERFGCSACHAGQGSGTEFVLASHTPNDSTIKDRWVKQYGWKYEAHVGNALWDFPMLPQRFVESSCIKCHHQVTDLIGSDNRNEAPKVTRGFDLIKENGCFGCHEIAGKKGGKQIGPDLRLEPYPPLEDLRPEDRAKAEADPDNPPGNLRKVGPSLFRVAEKTNPEWTVKWLSSPRTFRPDTKMPHFYGLSNNHPDALPAEQKDFPDAEMQSIAFFLFSESQKYLTKVAERAKDSPEVNKQDQEKAEALNLKGKLTDEERKDLDQINQRIKLRQVKPLIDLAPGYPGDVTRGRVLFSERGCLACHTHEATKASQGAAKTEVKKEQVANPLHSPAIISEANFGPNLSQLVDKLGKKQGDRESARIWLMQWVTDPHVHSPRSRMPVTHLNPSEAADVAAWLLNQPAQDLGPEWPKLQVNEPKMETLKALANVYLVRLLSKSDMKAFAEGKPVAAFNDLPEDEKQLYGKVDDPEGLKNADRLKYYLGKKAVGRLGCYACHDIPAFESAKPIGVGLNDWGKKDADRLAFEDIKHFFDDHYYPVDNLVDKDGKVVGKKDGKEPYEKFYSDLLLGHRREGYLNQKIIEPRSYDHNRLRSWDDRLRMPQFRLARGKQLKDESDADYEARSRKDEAEAREAVNTFILGLTSEQVPEQSINRPKGDRLAEVKGRQVLDKFNCAGCHLIRPGVYDFQATPETIEKLTALHEVRRTGAGKTEHFFPDDSHWVGRNPVGDKLTAYGVMPSIIQDADAKYYFQTRLTYALRFEGLDKVMRDLPGGGLSSVRIAPPAMLDPKFSLPQLSELYDKVKEQVPEEQLNVAVAKTMTAYLRDKAPYGGTFKELLVAYLQEKNKDLYKDEGLASSAAPPSLMGQGERTQGEWLYRFLLDPQPIRKMTVLRMPKFNMSKDEAKILVDYFAAVERTMNPGPGLSAPFEKIPQQDDLDGPYWTTRNKEYLARLKATGPMVKNKDGAEARAGDKTWYDKRVEELTPIWQQVQKESQDQLKQAQEKLKLATEQEGVAAELVKKETDPVKKKALEERAKAVETSRLAWEAEAKNLENAVTQSSLEEQKKLWSEKEAYITDAFRLVNSKALCFQCHQTRPGLPVTNTTQGPPLYLAHERLRPGWLERWIAVPSRHVPFMTPMPMNFPADDNSQYNDLLAGTSFDRVRASRDVLMNYPRALSLAASRYVVLPLPADKEKTGEKK